jgi:hypothetical protein
MRAELKADLYAEFALPPSAIEVARSAERKLADRLALAGAAYEVGAAILAYRRVMAPMLAALASVVDPEGEPTEDWTREYVERRAGLEAEAIYDGVAVCFAEGVAFATNHWKDARRSLHVQEREVARWKHIRLQEEHRVQPKA